MLGPVVICVAIAFCGIPLVISDDDLPHYKIVVVTDNLGNIAKNPSGDADEPFVGAYIDLLKAVAPMANFTYELSAQPDNEYGKKQKNGKWSGMIGSIVDGKADIGLATWVVTADRKAVVDFSLTIIDDYVASVLVNPKFGTAKAQYLSLKGLELYLLKKSADPTAKKIYANIKAHNKTAIVQSVEDAAKMVAKGNFAFVGDADSVDSMVDFYNGTLAMDDKHIDTGVALAAFATKKGSPLSKKFQSADMFGDSDTLSDALSQGFLEY